MKSFHFYKKVFAISIFSSTVLISCYLKNRKEEQMKLFLTNFEMLKFPKELFKAKVNLYRYKGVVFTSQIAESGLFNELSLFKFKKDDIIVASFPKSGTTWVQEIVHMLANDCQSTDESMETKFPYLEYPYPGIKSIEKMRGSRFIKTHLPYNFLPKSVDEVKPKIIYITRNPRDIAVSYYHFMKLLTEANFIGSFHQFVQLFIQNNVPYSPLGSHIKSYKERSENILMIFYEDLKENPFLVIKEIAEFMEINLSEDDLWNIASATTFTSMKDNPSCNYEHWKQFGFANPTEHFMRKGKVGDWKNYFNEDILKDFEVWEESQNFSVTFKYDL